ncbi:uncharacterized protein BX663DRAFT_154109 [Cokeromyces recurvatus]|uniref:uncharacterized protein n=1 Tax=Cokeromyces recurvatus TaxID=90255 RepID=UPI00222090BC|nr:uncharacterized protein BX663DRAFT_154109 [Cokeromyces recurvatus]KAI7900706.1 hypothetical protein BX663DRAFT_154109 [Cokeromyces recurvatus]
MSNLTVGNIKNDDTTQPTDILIAVTSHRNEDSQKIKYSRNSSLVFNSEKPNSTIHEESKNIDYSQQVQKECSSNLAENLKNTQDEKLIQSNELFNEILADTTSLFQTIMIPQSKFLKEHSIKLKQQELKDILNEDEVIHLLFKIWEQEIERVYNGEIQKIKDEIQQKNTVIKKTYEKNKWLTQTTVEIEEKLKTIETEMESSEDFNSDEQSLHKQLKCIIQSILGIEIDSCKEYRVNYEDLSWKIKKKSIQLRHDMDTIGALYNNLAWESQLRRKQNKCFDIYIRNNIY